MPNYLTLLLIVSNVSTSTMVTEGLYKMTLTLETRIKVELKMHYHRLLLVCSNVSQVIGHSVFYQRWPGTCLAFGLESKHFTHVKHVL